MLPVGLLVGRYAYRFIVTVPKAVLVPTIAFMTVIGSYAIRNSVSDVIIMLVLGVLGWVLGRFGFTASPIVLGLILGPIAEQGFVQGYLIGNIGLSAVVMLNGCSTAAPLSDATGNVWGNFFGRPIAIAIIALTLLSTLWPLVAARLRRRGALSENRRER